MSFVINPLSAICVQDCTFINNTVIDNFGGAIYADSSLLSIANSSFTLNRCVSVGGVGGGLASEQPFRCL